MQDAADLSRWWSEDDLETCPQCGEPKLVPAEPVLSKANVRVCVACGLVAEPEAAP